MTDESFRRTMSMLQTYFGKTIPDMAYPIYWKALGALTEHQWAMAAEKLITGFSPTSAKPFPLVPDFVVAAGIGGESRAYRAVATIRDAAARHGAYKSVSFGDSALHRVVIRYGGWPVLARWGDEEWRYRLREFVTVLQNEWTYGHDGTDHCPGLHELENNRTEPVIVCPLVSDDRALEVATLERAVITDEREDE